MSDRRRTDRRRLPLVPEPLERRGERRREERRDSPRQPSLLRVAFDGHEHAVRGEWGLGGASYLTAQPPPGDEVEVAFAAGESAFLSRARVVGRHAAGALTRVRLAFEATPVTMELSLARWLATSPP